MDAIKDAIKDDDIIEYNELHKFNFRRIKNRRYIYFLITQSNTLASMHTNAIKIGIASDLKSRMSALKALNLINLKLIYTFNMHNKYAGYIEYCIHSRFMNLYIRNEWFIFNSEIEKFVQSLPHTLNEYIHECLSPNNFLNKRFEIHKVHIIDKYNKIIESHWSD